MTPQVSEQIIDIVKIEKKEHDALTMVQDWKVVTREEYIALDSYLVGLLALKKEIEADFYKSESDARKAKKAATDALASIVAQKEGHLGKVDDARRLGKQKLDDYDTRQAELLRIENDRIAAENKKRAEDAALEAAAVAEKYGDHEKAADIIQNIPTEIVKPAAYVPQRSTIISVRWSATITDPFYVMKAIEVAGKVLAKSKGKDAQEACDMLRQAHADVKYMAYDQVALNRQATATKDALKLGGVTFSSRKV